MSNLERGVLGGSFCGLEGFPCNCRLRPHRRAGGEGRQRCPGCCVIEQRGVGDQRAAPEVRGAQPRVAADGAPGAAAAATGLAPAGQRRGQRCCCGASRALRVLSLCGECAPASSQVSHGSLALSVIRDSMILTGSRQVCKPNGEGDNARHRIKGKLVCVRWLRQQVSE